MATYATGATKRFQWESNSAPSQSWNCGPTCASMIASYYRGVYYGIEATRRLVAPPYTSTNSGQQRDMLIKRGVPATVRHLDTVAQLHALVDSGRRPVIIGMRMDLVPSWVRDHPFTGWHAVVVMSGGSKDGTRGFWINDPNFSPAGGIRPDPDRGMKWYPDWVLQQAWANNSPRYVVVPNSLKPLPTSTTTTKGRGKIAGPGCNIRTSAVYGTTNIYARSNVDGYTYRISDGRRLWANSSLYYFYGWTTDGKWARVATGSGQKLFIAREVFKVVTNP